jgi:hypothetical protein
MTGMAISIVGLLTYTILNSKSQSLISELWEEEKKYIKKNQV